MNTQPIVHFRIRNGKISFEGTNTFNKVFNQRAAAGEAVLINRTESGKFCKPFFADNMGNFLITLEDAKKEVGIIQWDENLDMDVCKFLSECNEKEIEAIEVSNEWNKKELLNLLNEK